MLEIQENIGEPGWSSFSKILNRTHAAPVAVVGTMGMKDTGAVSGSGGTIDRWSHPWPRADPQIHQT